MSPDDPRHGTRKGYWAHRRAGEQACEPCLIGNNRHHKLFLLGRVGRYVDPTGTRRRIEALVCLGWSFADLGEATGHSKNWTQELMRSARVHQDTAAAVAAIYDRLSMTLAPENGYRGRTRNLAQRRGYQPPLAWDEQSIDDPNAVPYSFTKEDADDADYDEVVVDRILSGDYRLPATRTERLEVIRRWERAGAWSLNELERRTGWNINRDKGKAA